MHRRFVLLAIALVARPLCAQPAHPAVFVVNNVSDEISSFAMDDLGVVTLLGTAATSDGPLAAALTPSGTFLAVTHGTQNDVVETLQVFAVAADASLSLVLETTVPDAPLATAWLADDVLAVVETDFGGGNFVHAYRFDAEDPALVLVDSVPTGGFTTALARHPFRPVLYTQDSVGNTITWIEHDEAGMLEILGTRSTGGTFPLRLAVTRDADMLYPPGGISSGGHAVIGAMLDGTGAPTLHPDSPFFSPGDSPAYVAVSSDDRFLFVGHGGDATLHVFEIEDGGAITPTGYVFDVGLQGTLGDLQVLGRSLLVTDESTAVDGVAGLYSFRIEPDGTLAKTGPIVHSGGVRPESIVVWAPPLTGDVNGDGVVDVEDLLIVLTLWGHVGSAGDVNGDGIVDFADLLLVLANWSS